MPKEKGRLSSSDAKTVLPARDNSGGKDKPGGGIVVTKTRYNTEKGGMTSAVVRSVTGGWVIQEENDPLDENAA